MSAKRSQDVEDLHSTRMLQLARASREAFAAYAKYRLLRLHEVDVLRTIAYDDFEEAQSFVKDADRQIGELRHDMSSSGVPLFQGRGSASVKLSPVPSCSDASDAEESELGFCRGSPSPSRFSSSARL